MTDLSKWRARLGTRIEAVKDPNQRTLLLSERVVELSPARATRFLREQITENFAVRDPRARTMTEAAMMALLTETWPGEHRKKALRAAVRAGDRLVSIYLGHVRVASENDEDTMELPDYGADRPLTLGERRSLAATPDRKLIALAVRDPHPMVVEKLLSNPKITEKDVIYLSSRRPASYRALVQVAIHPRFRTGRSVASALVHNPHTPASVALTLLPCLDLPTIKSLKKDATMKTLLRETAEQILLAVEDV